MKTANSKPTSPDFTQRHAEIASVYGFRISREFGNTDFYRKDAPDGSFWLASTAAGLPFNLAPPENQIWFIGRFLSSDAGEAQNVVHETLPIEIVLAEHERLPVPEFDIDGDPIKRDFDTWLDLAWHGRTDRGNRSNRVKAERVIRAMDGFTELLDEGFHLNLPEDSEDIVFSMDDEETGTAYIVTNSEDPNRTHPSGSGWSVVRFRDGEDGDECIGVSNTTVDEIVSRYRDIPTPRKGQDEYYSYFSDWNQLDAHIHEAALDSSPV